MNCKIASSKKICTNSVSAFVDDINKNDELNIPYERLKHVLLISKQVKNLYKWTPIRLLLMGFPDKVMILKGQCHK